MTVVSQNKYQIGTNVLILLPDPTFGAGGSTTWAYEVYNVTTAAVVVTDTLAWPADGNAIKIGLAENLFPLGNLFRVRVLNNLSIVVQEFFFTTYTNNFSSGGPTNIAAINDLVTRICGLMGYHAVHEVTNLDQGVAVDSSVRIYDRDPDDDGAVLVGEYVQKKITDPTSRVIGEISARRV